MDVVVTQCSAIFQLLSSKDQSLLIRRDSFLILNLGLDIVNCVRGFHIESDGLPRQSLNENLHGEIVGCMFPYAKQMIDKQPEDNTNRSFVGSMLALSVLRESSKRRVGARTTQQPQQKRELLFVKAHRRSKAQTSKLVALKNAFGSFLVAQKLIIISATMVPTDSTKINQLLLLLADRLLHLDQCIADLPPIISFAHRRIQSFYSCHVVLTHAFDLSIMGVALG